MTMNRTTLLVLSMSLFGCVTASTPPAAPPAPMTAYEIQSEQARKLGLDAQIDHVDAQIQSMQGLADSARMRAAQYQMMQTPGGESYEFMSQAEAEAATYESQLHGLMAVKAHLESQRAIQ